MIGRNVGAAAVYFARVWQESPDIAAVCERLGITPESAYNRAAYMRRQGVELKRFSRTNWDRVAAAITKEKKPCHR
jgi:hypothetical protein